jgi:hypothetical protein
VLRTAGVPLALTLAKYGVCTSVSLARSLSRSSSLELTVGKGQETTLPYFTLLERAQPTLFTLHASTLGSPSHYAHPTALLTQPNLTLGPHPQPHHLKKERPQPSPYPSPSPAPQHLPPTLLRPPTTLLHSTHSSESPRFQQGRAPSFAYSYSLASKAHSYKLPTPLGTSSPPSAPSSQ